MFALFAAPENVLFTFTLICALGIALLEILGIACGVAFFQSIDNWLSARTPSSCAQRSLFGFWAVLSWLRIGQMPFLLLFIIFLICFTFTGLALQTAVNALVGSFLPRILATVLGLGLALPCFRWLSGLVARIFYATRRTLS